MKTIKKTVAVILCIVILSSSLCMSAFADPPRGNLIHFVPTTIVVDPYSIYVEGYFVNLNTDVTVCNFSDYYMECYQDGYLLVSGYFGTINSFEVYPLSGTFQSFTFTGSHNLNSGTYYCDDSIYCKFECNFQAY